MDAIFFWYEPVWGWVWGDDPEGTGNGPSILEGKASFAACVSNWLASCKPKLVVDNEVDPSRPGEAAFLGGTDPIALPHTGAFRFAWVDPASGEPDGSTPCS